jgi:DNA-directed RNA polymerase specialized sigma24 family protein
MLKLLKQSLAHGPDSHEDIFLRRYELLYGWALRLTRGDHQKAEDLVQDAFVQFTTARPDLDRLENPEGYLYGMPLQ